MKIHRKTKSPKTIRKGRGILIMSPQVPQQEIISKPLHCANLSMDSNLHLHYKEGQVYAFTVCSCYSDQMKDGTQKTRYIVRDKLGIKHTYYCDCTCFEIKQEIYLRVRTIGNNKLKFEDSNIVALNEIFIKGEEYEFEVISYQKDHYVVCDTQIGKNHSLCSDDAKLYKNRELLKLEVEGFDDSGCLLLIDRNPPAPMKPCKNSLQELAASMEKEKQNKASAVQKKGKQTDDSRRNTKRQLLVDTPKVVPSIAIPCENRKVLVQNIGYPLPIQEKTVKHTSNTEPRYTISIKPSRSEGGVSQGIEEGFLQLAKKGNIECQFLLAKHYESHGHIVEATKWYKNAARKGFFESIVSLYRVGNYYELGEGVTRNEQEAYSCYKIAADQKYADAQYKMGLFFALGKGGVYVDDEKARYYWQLAAESGHVAARVALEKGLDSPKPIWISKVAKGAVEKLRAYAKKADADSYYCIGQFFEERKWYKWALINYMKAWDLDLEEAYFKIAGFKEKGRGCDRDFTAAIDIYLQFAFWGDKRAIQRLWEIIHNTNLRSDLDWVKRATWLGSETERGQALINKGKEWQKCGDLKGAFNAYRAALYFDVPEAYYLYAVCYEKGWGITASDGQAMLYYEKAASAGIIEAYLRMGEISERNNEYNRALTYYRSAQKLRRTDAEDAIRRVNQILCAASGATDAQSEVQNKEDNPHQGEGISFGSVLEHSHSEETLTETKDSSAQLAATKEHSRKIQHKEVEEKSLQNRLPLVLGVTDKNMMKEPYTEGFDVFNEREIAIAPDNAAQTQAAVSVEVIKEHKNTNPWYVRFLLLIKSLLKKVRVLNM